MSPVRYFLHSKHSTSLILFMMLLLQESYASEINTISSKRPITAFTPFAKSYGNTSKEQSSSSKHIGTAMILALGGTILPTLAGFNLPDNSKSEIIGNGLVGFGLVIGPSIGKLYAHDYKSARNGILLRILAGAVTLYIAENSIENDVGILAVVGFVTGSISLVSNIFTTPKSVRKYNEKHTSLCITPIFERRKHVLGARLTIVF